MQYEQSLNRNITDSSGETFLRNQYRLNKRRKGLKNVFSFIIKYLELKNKETQIE